MWNWDLHKDKVAHKLFISEGAEFTAHLLHLCVRRETRGRMGIKNCDKENNQIVLRNTDYLFPGKSIVDKNKQKKQHHAHSSASRTEGGHLNVVGSKTFTYLWPVLQVFVNMISCKYGELWCLIFPRLQDISIIWHTHKHTHTTHHTSLCHTHTSNHQDLDFVLFVRPVEEGDAWVLSEEGGGS